ncbi:MAG: DUF3015 family protein [Alphaproteobacteria bacterium]|nr:DUF3015 family protein [Alphaproteobacteria bacterium]
MNKLYLSLFAAGLAAFASDVHAIDSTGCGLGSMAWRGQSGIAPQVLAVTTNASFGTQTFGITFGTSGCDPNGRVTGGTGRMMLAFLENNMEQYAMDAAAGYGETIDTLAGILNMDSAKLGEMSKQNFAVLFPNENIDAVTLTLNVMEMVKQA